MKYKVGGKYKLKNSISEDSLCVDNMDELFGGRVITVQRYDETDNTVMFYSSIGHYWLHCESIQKRVGFVAWLKGVLRLTPKQ